jgi:hypothetical protein
MVALRRQTVDRFDEAPKSPSLILGLPRPISSVADQTVLDAVLGDTDAAPPMVRSPRPVPLLKSEQPKVCESRTYLRMLWP